MSLDTVQRAVSAPGRRLVTRYLLLAAAMNLVWEVAQLPLYTLWQTATRAELIAAVAHCTAGDLLILMAALGIALLFAGDRAWPGQGYARVAIATTVLGLGYMIFSEWLNVEVLRNWAYAPAMLLVPPFGTGLTPLLQWLIIPPMAATLVRPAGVPTCRNSHRSSDEQARQNESEGGEPSGTDRRHATENLSYH